MYKPQQESPMIPLGRRRYSPNTPVQFTFTVSPNFIASMCQFRDSQLKLRDFGQHSLQQWTSDDACRSQRVQPLPHALLGVRGRNPVLAKVRNRKWNGVLLEPVPKLVDQLQHNHLNR